MTTRQKLNTPFHRLTEEEIRRLISDKLIATACYLLAIRRITRPPGAKFVISNVLEFCEKWGITKSAFYRAVNDLKRKGYTEWKTTHSIVFKDSSKVLTFPTLEKRSTDSLEEQQVESRERDYEPVEQTGSRLPVRTAAESGLTLENLKKIYPNNWQDVAMYFGLEVSA